VASTPGFDFDREILRRRLTHIMLVRVILFTLVLGGTVAVNLFWGTPEDLGGPYVTFLFVVIAVVYVVNILYVVLFKLLPSLALLAKVQLGIDLISSAILVHFTGGADSGFVLFFLLTPVAAAVTLRRREVLVATIVGTAVLAAVVLLGYARLLPALPGQVQFPWEVTPDSVRSGLIVRGMAMIAIGVLAGYLAEQLRLTSERMEVQQAHIDDLSALNADIIRCLTSGLITVSEAGRILTMNHAAGEILGLPHHQATGRMLTDLPDGLAEAVAQAQELRRSEVNLVHGNKSQLLGISVSPLTDHLNKVRGRIINFQDLTSIREMEEVVRHSEHLASLGRMAAGIAHEIRNPLASISGSLELLRAADQLEADDRKLMDIALREIERLNGLITSFLDYARPKPLKVELLDLGQEIHGLVAGITGLMTGRDSPNVKVEAAEAGLWVQADRDQLRGVLWNLVRNAWEAGEEDLVRVRVQERTDGRVELIVADRGEGISPEQLKHVFEPFFTTKESGTGLGLATVHRIVQEHGGSVQITTDRGQGTTLTIVLPRQETPIE
jgi:two-component system sensor histidine kinase PilS (NtrC family)